MTHANRILSKRNLLVALAAIAGLIVAIVTYRTNSAIPETKGPLNAQVRVPAAARSDAPAATAPSTTVAPAAEQLATASTELTKSKEITAGQEESDRLSFKVDAAGHVITDEQARLDIEKLFALNTPQQRAAKVQELQESMPANAAGELAQLMERYDNYQAASRQAYPPGREMTAAEEGLQEIDGLHGLRVQYFGADVASGFFGAEERMQRELLKLVALEKDQGMTMEEKVERAQAMYQSELPEISAANERGMREAAAAQQR